MPKHRCAVCYKADTEPDKELEIYIDSAEKMSHSVHHRQAQLEHAHNVYELCPSIILPST